VLSSMRTIFEDLCAYDLDCRVCSVGLVWRKCSLGAFGGVACSAGFVSPVFLPGLFFFFGLPAIMIFADQCALWEEESMSFLISGTLGYVIY
jgi:hypothetical protein